MGPPVYPEDYLLCAENSLIDQSRHARMGRTTTNGDGFGLGWYGGRDEPGLFRDIRPAWNDDNLRNIAAQVRSPQFFAHVRAATNGGIARNNCHPFRYGRWLFMHNGQIGAFDKVRREIDCLIDDAYYHHRLGTTDSETFFCLMLTHGLENDPPGAFARTVAQVEQVKAEQGVNNPLRLTAALTDGETTYAIRYASDPEAPTLYIGHNEPAEAGAAPLLIVSEPLDSCPDHWQEVEMSHLVTARDGHYDIAAFAPDGSGL
jgi:glutamine amidotransferase